MTRREAVKLFKSEIYPKWKEETKTTVRCAFNDWVDQLNKSGEITDRQAFNWCWNDGKL